MRVLLDQENKKSYLFENPSFVIECHKLSQLESILNRMEDALKRGYYLAGFISYEAGYAFEKVFYDNKTYDFPLVCFGAYRTPPPLPLSLRERGEIEPPIVKIKWDKGNKPHYLSAIKTIKQHLAAGDTYQVNYTFKHKFNFKGSPFNLYQRLKKRQSTPYSAFIKSNDFSILSLSPELFFRKWGNKIKMKPMKGTSHLGRGQASRLENDPKNQSENIMIVDLLRNDLGRVAKTGTVKTRKLFEVEKYQTLYQMTSTIEAEIPANIPLRHLFRSLFPSGSVTGAPKIRTMQIIRELEKEERNIYTGSIGFITPDKDMVFNVAIRTILLSRSYGEMGVGSGIVFDSDPEKEYEECLLKSRFLFAD